MSNDSAICEDIFLAGSDICGIGVPNFNRCLLANLIPQVRWGLYTQMAMSLTIPLLPWFGEEIAISFGTGALVTSIALITTGFTQGMRSQIAYYQEAIIVQMAGMGSGPAALAWLNDEPDSVFFGLTILYGIVMAGYLFYTLAEQASSSSPVIDCFLDKVPSMYGKTALKTANSIIVSLSLVLMALAIITRTIVNRWRRRNDDHHQRRLRGIRWYRVLFALVIFIAETVLAVLINLTLNEYGKFVSSNDRDTVSAWQFGQIIPLMMLLQPFMDVIRALKQTFFKMWKEKKEERARQASSGSPSDNGGIVKKIMSSSDADIEAANPKILEPQVKEVEVTETDVVAKKVKEIEIKEGEIKSAETRDDGSVETTETSKEIGEM
jgi:hypothetical protein